MNKSIAMAVLSAAGIAHAVFGQTVTPNPDGYTYEFRIIADGTAGAPTSANYPSFNISNTATQIGFWIQARVAQTINQNWGIVRVSPPAAPDTSFVTVTDPVGSTIQRGQTTNLPGYGRGSGYRSGGTNNGPTGNVNGSVAFPGTLDNENGGIDSSSTRIYSFDSYVGSTRPPQDADNPTQPWGVNGATSGASVGNPVPSDGTFSPWASVYRFVVMPTDVNSPRTISLDAYAMVQGALDALPTDASLSSFAMHIGPGRNMDAVYSFNWGVAPTPGAVALLGLGAFAGTRRRR